MYNPRLGSFMQRDPFAGVLSMPASMNGYGYVHGNPVNWTDPSGQFVFLPVLFGAVAIGGVTAAAWNIFVEQGIGLGGSNQFQFGCIDWKQALGRAGFGAEIGLNIGVGYGIAGLVRGLGLTGLTAIGANAFLNLQFALNWDWLMGRPVGPSLVNNLVGSAFGGALESVGYAVGRLGQSLSTRVAIALNDFSLTFVRSFDVTNINRIIDIDDGKIGYLFGRASGRSHNIQRAYENLGQMSRIGIPNNDSGWNLVRAHLFDAGMDSSNIVRSYSNQYGNFTIKESLLAGPGGFVKLETTWQEMSDDSLRFITAIPFGAGFGG